MQLRAQLVYLLVRATVDARRMSSAAQWRGAVGHPTTPNRPRFGPRTACTADLYHAIPGKANPRVLPCRRGGVAEGGITPEETAKIDGGTFCRLFGKVTEVGTPVNLQGSGTPRIPCARQGCAIHPCAGHSPDIGRWPPAGTCTPGPGRVKRGVYHSVKQYPCVVGKQSTDQHRGMILYSSEIQVTISPVPGGNPEQPPVSDTNLIDAQVAEVPRNQA